VSTRSLRAVIFDYYGTLVWYRTELHSAYADTFARHGYTLDPATETAYFTRHDGLDHLEHSESRERYEAWVRERHSVLARSCSVPEDQVAPLVDALRAQDGEAVTTYPDSIDTLRALRDRGFLVGICSNWGWDLEDSLRQAGLDGHVDAAVTSARVGFRKPHRQIYAAIAERLRCVPTEALFVGDSLHPDVTGPLAVGMDAVHVWRHEASDAPPLPVGARRVKTVGDLLDWPSLSLAAPS
jgi:putative hydrolase of the HAD superfamily